MSRSNRRISEYFLCLIKEACKGCLHQHYDECKGRSMIECHLFERLIHIQILGLRIQINQILAAALTSISLVIASTLHYSLNASRVQN